MRAVLLLAGLGVCGFPVLGLAQQAPVVVELFTSQGCSSCPPADAFLTDLARQRRDVLPLAFHITYWDNLAWKDPYSLQAATIRQQDYARRLDDDQVYTPEMVVGGAHAFVGSDRVEGLNQISRAANAPSVPLRLARKGETLVISVGQGAGHGTIMLVGFDSQHRTPIARGENGGRTVLESNIVRSLDSAGKWTGAALELQHAAPTGEEFAVLLQADDGRILGAARLGAAGS
jgi:hypothetical protein